jgi:hypothetical protein
MRDLAVSMASARPAYRFDQGSDTADLKNAKALLGELSWLTVRSNN